MAKGKFGMKSPGKFGENSKAIASKKERKPEMKHTGKKDCKCPKCR